MINILKVFLWGREIGRLMMGDGGYARFFFNKSEVSSIPNIVPFQIQDEYWGRDLMVGYEEEKIYKGLPAFIADSLPDAWGMQLLELWAEENRIPKGEINVLDRLSFMGKRGMGAFEFIPENMEFSKPIKGISVADLISAAQRVYEERSNVSISSGEDLSLKSLLQVGSSAGGARPKAIIAINKETGEIVSGQIAGRSDYDYFILKFGDKGTSSAEIEMAYHDMALDAGIPMTRSSLMNVGGVNHFLTERFDRPGGEKIITQTLAAINPEARSYEDLLYTCRSLDVGEKECEQVFRQMVFNILANNTDDHRKNFSFFMGRDGRWHVTPAYDMMFLFDAGGFRPSTEHCLTVAGKRTGITIADVLALADENSIKKARQIVAEVAKAVMNFNTYAEKYDIEPIRRNTIFETIRRNLICWGLDVGSEESRITRLEVNGAMYEDIRIEVQHKGNIRFSARCGERELRFFFRPGMEDYSQLATRGMAQTDKDMLEDIIAKYFSGNI